MSMNRTTRRDFGGLTARLGLWGLVPPAATGLGLFAAGLARADALPPPAGKVVLSLQGAIARTNADGRADFDMDMIAALPQHDIVTQNPWYDGVHTFTGPLLRDLLARVGASGTQLKAVALNEYKVAIPREDTERFPVVMARLLDGKPMPVRAKGPLFVMYPFSAQPELRNDRYYNRCAWQLRTLEVA